MRLLLDLQFLENELEEISNTVFNPDALHMTPGMINEAYFFDEMRKIELNLKSRNKKLAVNKKDVYKK